MRYVVLFIAGGILAVAVVIYLPQKALVKTAPSGSKHGSAVAHKHMARRLVVKRPWRPGRPQKGVAIYFKALPNPTNLRMRAAARQTFDFAVSLGANSVSLSFPFYTGGILSNQVFGRRSTPSPHAVALVLQEARAHKLRVTLRPILDEANLVAQGWRGSIEPTNRNQWFASYERFLKPYLKVATANHAATFSIGVELNSLLDDPGWVILKRKARHLFHGELLYSANWNGISGLAPRLADALGVDAYFATYLQDNSSLKSVELTWSNWLGQHRLARHRVVLSEVGIAAETGAYQHPWLWGSHGHAIDLKVQQRWFAAACWAFKHSKLAGVYFWRLNFGQDFASLHWDSADHGTFVARPAATAIKRCF